MGSAVWRVGNLLRMYAVSKRMQTFNMDELVQLSAQAEEGSAMAELPGMIKNPDQEDAVVELVQEYLGLQQAPCP